MTRRCVFSSFLALFAPVKRTEVTIGTTGGDFYAYWTDPDGTWHTSGPVSFGQATTIARNVLISERT